MKSNSSWNEKYSEKKLKLLKLVKDKEWKTIFENYEYHLELPEKTLKDLLSKNKDINIYPYPKLLFNAFDKCKFDDIKVVILGQDPYHGCEYVEEYDMIVPQAMGLSFSVPSSVKIPSSLNNIYKNLKKYKNIKDIPDNGDLTTWAKQGCLMLNSSLTVVQGSPNIHQRKWEKFTDCIIKYISDNKKHVVFMLWGKHALNKCEYIDIDKHFVSISSHPSGLSNNKELGKYPSFNNTDHFGNANKYLENNNIDVIDWNI